MMKPDQDALHKEHKALEVFGNLLINRVRDVVISEWNRIIEGKMKSDISKNINQVLLTSYDEEQIALLRRLIPQIVDTTLHHLLWTIEQNEEMIALVVATEAGLVPSLRDASEGLPGELYTESGWIARFSEYPFERGLD